MPFLFLLYIVAYLDRINMGFAVLQMRGQLGLSDRVIGHAGGMFFAGYFLFQLPSYLVLEKFGVRSEVNVFVEERNARVTGEMQKELVLV